MRLSPLASYIAVAQILLVTSDARSLEVFSAGMSVPETISLAPAGFGSLAGYYLVPDPGLEDSGFPSVLWAVPPGGGAPFPVANDFAFGFWMKEWRGGLFLPPEYGTNAGKFLIAADYALGSFDSSRVVSVINQQFLDSNLTRPGGFTTPIIAPINFGAYGGQVFVTYQKTEQWEFLPDPFDPFGGIYNQLNSTHGGIGRLNPNGTFDRFATIDFVDEGSSSFSDPFGLVSVPEGFGAVAGQLLVSSGTSGEIVAIDSNGQQSAFANIPIAPGQEGLRQMAFVPEGFGDLSGLLMISVSGSHHGGGTFGSLLALGETGEITYTLKVGSEFDKFDPRGIAFTNDGHILISDASDPILIGSVSDFIAVPEASTCFFGLCGAALIAALARRKRVALGN